MSVRIKLVILSVFVLLGNGAIGYLIYKSNQNLRESEQWIYHTEQVINEAGNILALGIDIETSSRGFVITNDSAFLAPLNSGRELAFRYIKHLRKLTEDNPIQQKRVDSIDYYMRMRLAFSSLSVEIRSTQGLDAAIRHTSTKQGKYYTDQLRKITRSIQDDEAKLLAIRKQENSLTVNAYDQYAILVFILMAVFTILLIVITGYYLNQSEEKEKRAAELIIANKELAFQNSEKEKRAAELLLAIKELAFQNEEKEKRAAELIIANKELAFQNEEKENRASELLLANKELAFQNEEKEKRAEELTIAKYARSLIEASLDPLVTISSDGKILDVNEASVKVTGVSREELIGTDFSNYFTQPDKAREGYLQVFEKGFVSDYPLTIRHTSNKLIDVLYNASVYKDDAGIVQGVFAAARDVTEQKQASKYARSLIEASLDPLVTISTDGKILDVNEASVKVTGVPREELIGTDFSNYFTQPDKAQEGYLQVFEKGFVADYPLTVRNVNGNLTDVLYNASVYKDDKGNILGVFAAARDVTEQKWAIDLRIANKELAFQNSEKENRAAELLLANKELAFQNSEKEKRAAELLLANEELAFQNSEKENRANELLLANEELAFQNEEKENRAAELIIANQELIFQNQEKENRAAELVIANKELKFQNEEKGKRAAELVIADKEVIAQSEEKEILFRDNEQKEEANLILEKALVDLKATQTLLIQSEKMASLGELTAGIAHEIQNPLNFVNNFSELNSELIVELKEELGKGNLEEAKSLAGDIDENEQKILHHGRRADSIVKGMLQHSRSSTGKKEPTDINALADEYLRLAYHGLRAKDKSFNAKMETNFDPSIGKINVIPQDLGRVILNLITNAFYVVDEKKKICLAEPVEANRNYEPIVSVSTKKLGDKIEIIVKDNGNGIPQKILDKIFQPFFTTKPTGQGTGLGLSLSYDIVKAHGGEMTVETTEGEGSTFVIKIPLL